jgi:hypothetical protein
MQEGIEDAGFLVLHELNAIHPLEKPIIERRISGQRDFHLRVDVQVGHDQSQSSVFRVD